VCRWNVFNRECIFVYIMPGWNVLINYGRDKFIRLYSVCRWNVFVDDGCDEFVHV
jgi:hypothetical protein